MTSGPQRKNLKEQCHHIFAFFCLKDSTKRFREHFRFRKDIRLQSLKILSPCSQRQRRHAIFFVKGKSFFIADTDVFICLKYCYWVCKHNQVPFFTWLFLYNLWEALKVCKKCPRSLVRVRVVVDYADTVIWLYNLWYCLFMVCWSLNFK